MTSKRSTIRVDEAWDQAAPRRMMRELGLLQNLASDLIHTISKCSVPLGFRQSSGSHIHTLIHKILEVSHDLKVAEEDVTQHQEMIAYCFCSRFLQVHKPCCSVAGATT